MEGTTSRPRRGIWTVLGLLAIVLATFLAVRVRDARAQKPVVAAPGSPEPRLARRRVMIGEVSTDALEASGPPEVRPILVLEGFLAREYGPSDAMESFVVRLARRHGLPVVALKLPWVSAPGPVPEGPLPDHLVDWARKAVNVYQPVEVWAHSLGWMLVQALLKRGELRGVRVVATSPAGICLPRELRALHKVKDRAVPRLAEMDPERRSWLVRAATTWTALKREHVEGMLDLINANSEAAAWWARVGEVLDWLYESTMAMEQGRTRVRSRARSSPGPGPDVMVIADPDPLVPRRALEIAHRRWPDTEIVELPFRGHAVYQDPALPGIVDEFFKAMGSGSTAPANH